MRVAWMFGLVFFWCVHTAWGTLVDRIVAVVNGEIITWSELEAETNRFLAQAGPNAPDETSVRKMVLDSLINDILVHQEAERLQVTVSDSDVENALREFKTRRRLSDAEFQHGLTLQGTTLEDFKKQLRSDLMRRRILSFMVQRKVVVTEEEIQAYYDSHAQQFRSGRHVTLQLAVLPSQEDAEKIAAAVKKGEITMDQAVREYSIGPRQDDGRMDVAWQDLGADWRRALSSLAEGQVSAPFVVQGKWVVVRLVRERTTDEGSGLDTVREEIREILARPKLEERFQEYMASLRAKALIDVRL